MSKVMLCYGLSKSHAGILLSGNYLTLRELQQVLHDVNEHSALIRDKEGPLLALAYDLRKAYEGQRKVIKPPEHTPEIGTRYGVELLWPLLLFQCRLLRDALAFMESKKPQLAMTYLLEDVIESALAEDFGPDAREIIEHWNRLDTRHRYAGTKIDSRCAQYCAWTKAQRRDGLSGLLLSLDSMYPALYPHWAKKGLTNLMAPEKLDEWEGLEWPDPKW